MAHSAGDLMAILANLGPSVCPGGSCTCPGATSRVVTLEFLLGRRSYASSKVWLTGVPELHSGRCGGVPSAWVPTGLGVALQYPGWWHSGGDGRTGPMATEEMRFIILTSWRHPGLALGRWSYAFRGCHRPLSEGCNMEDRRGYATQCPGVTLAIPHSNGTAPGMAAQQRVGRIAPGSDPQVVSGGGRGGDLLLTQAPTVCQNIYSLCRESRRGTTG
jgi:hypothetical protein